MKRYVLILTALWFLAGAWLTSDGGTSIDDLLILEMSAVALFVGGLVVAILAARHERSLRAAFKPGIAAIFVLLVVGTAVHWFEVATPVRFAVSRSALERHARAATTSELDSERPTRVGLFTVKETEALDGDVVRLITAECMMDECGFVYSPRRAPPRIGEDTYIKLSDGWYLWQRSF